MIITPALMLGAIKGKLESAFPGEPVYENLTPREFERPSNMVELVKLDLNPLSQGAGAVTFQYQYKITTYCVVDEVHDSHLPTLDLRCMTILGAFADGYVKAGDRAPKVTACTANTEGLYDYAEVKLTVSLAMDRSEFRSDEILPLMEDLNTKLNAKEKTI